MSAHLLGLMVMCYDPSSAKMALKMEVLTLIALWVSISNGLIIIEELLSIFSLGDITF